MQKGSGGQGDSGRKGTTSHGSILPQPRHALDLCLASPPCPQGLPSLGAVGLMNLRNTEPLSSAMLPDVTKSV